VLILLFIVFLGAMLYHYVRLVKRLSLLEKSQNSVEKENLDTSNPAVCAAIIAAINLHKSKQRQ
jgi:Na+-transporting methylmalonyl-CoA/oxaloacetate decarboxylase gamma subunit